MIDFRRINQTLQPNLLSYARSWAPGGKCLGKNYIALNPRRNDKKLGSFVLRLSDGAWKDFATGDSGGDIVSYYAYINNLSQFEAAQDLAGYRESPLYGEAATSPRNSKLSPVNDSNVTSLIKKIWRSSYPIVGTLAEKYLMNRGISLDLPGTLRYHPALWHSPSQQKLPCMVAAITSWPHKSLIGVHRTFLEPEGEKRISIKPNKMMLGHVNGGAVRLSPLSNCMMIAEGIETSLSLLLANPQACVWAALSAGGFKNLILPSYPFAQNILIAADNDPTGMQAAMEASNRWAKEGRNVKIALPPIGKDMNDLLQGGSE